MLQGRSFGRYLLGDQLGRGGMAAVFRARDPEFDRDVAIKVLPEDFLQDPEFRSRFQREARSIARLEHPSIVPVYDIGEEHGQPYLVMRFMTGGTLSQRLAAGPLPMAECASVMRRIASALEEAHRRGMVHRDIKPGNILFDSYGDAYLSDFGIVKWSQAATTLTGGAMIGTPAYMSPEQSEGRPDVGPPADIYALGVVLFQMLTGRLPFEADTPVGLALKHMREPVPQLSTIDPAAPPALQKVIERAMAKRPEDRYPAAGQLARALELAVSSPHHTAVEMGGALLESGEPDAAGRARASPPGPRPRSPGASRWRLRPGCLVGAILALLLAGAGLVLLLGGSAYLMSLVSPTEQAAVSVTETSPPISAPAPSQGPEAPAALSTWGPWLVFVQGSTLWAVNSDGSGLTQLADGLVTLRPGLAAGIAPSGANVAIISGSDDRHDLTLKIVNLVKQETIEVARLTSPETEPAPGDLPPYAPPTYIQAMTETTSLDWSLDGLQLAFIGAFEGDTADLYLYAYDGGQIQSLSDGPSQAINPLWSPDARWIFHAGVETLGSGAGASYDGAWAASPSDEPMATLLTFADDPSTIGILESLGWLDPTTVVLGLQDVVSGEASVVAYSVPGAESTLVRREPVSGSAADRTSGTILVSTDPSGLMLLRAGRSPLALSPCRAGQVTWQREAARFVATTDCGVFAVSVDGEFVTLAAPGGAWGRPSISVNGDIAWPGDGLWVSSLAEPERAPRQVYTGKVATVFWSPDGKFLLVATPDGLMVAASPVSAPTMVAPSVRIHSSLDAGWASWGWGG